MTSPRMARGSGCPHFEDRDRLPIHWPHDAQLAFSVFLYFEHWDVHHDASSVRDSRFGDPGGYFSPDFRTMGWREFGNRVGVFRVLEMLDRFGIRATVAANAMACEAYPYLVEQFDRRGYEFAAHGIDATRMISSRMTAPEEMALIEESRLRVAAAVGRQPQGWIGQDYGESALTPELLAKAGFSYVADWPNDDQPSRMSRSALVSIPSQAELDDVQFLWHRRVPLRHYAPSLSSAFSLLLDEGAAQGRFFGLHLHPWLIGTPHRSRELARFLSFAMSQRRVWQATAGDVAAHVAGNVPVHP